MSERERLRMNDEEVKAHLDACHRMQVATLVPLIRNFLGSNPRA